MVFSIFRNMKIHEILGQNLFFFVFSLFNQNFVLILQSDIMD